jgi:hypothetical protein
LVIPAKAGIQPLAFHKKKSWIPAFAGMTTKGYGLIERIRADRAQKKKPGFRRAFS